MANDDVTDSGQCPQLQLLEAFSQGQLDAIRASAIGTHVDSCPDCGDTLDKFAADDDLLALIRGENPLSAYTDEPEYGRLLVEARQPIDDDSERTRAWMRTPGESIGNRESVGDYLLRSTIARGGMGVVYRAHQPSLKRDVALKMILPGGDGGKSLERFKIESNAVARLQHPHVVQIFDVGDDQGRPYFTMELMEGGDLEQRVKEAPLTQRGVANLMRELADAIHHAHSKSVLHRDLKPSNVMFTSDGVAKISDFGLAKIFDAAAEELALTQDDAILGTPAYMSPEQARGDVEQVGVAADVYGLGAVLYRILADRPPFLGKNRLEVIRRVRDEAPTPPSEVATQAVDHRLEEICLKCMAKEPGQRYATAHALSEDLGNWLEGQPTQPQLERKKRRYRVLLASVALVLAAAGLGFGANELRVRRSPQRKLQTLQAAIAQGGEVSLIGPAGLPQWRLLAGSLGDAALDESNGYCSFRSKGPTFALLVEDPQHDTYRIQAELRHSLVGTVDCGVGLFVAHQSWQLTERDVHAALVVRFSDMHDEPHRSEPARMAIPEAHRPPPQKGNAVTFYPYVLAMEADGELLEAMPGGEDQFFQTQLDTWRRITIDVYPDKVLVQWEGREDWMKIPLSEANEAVGSAIRRIADNALDADRQYLSPRGGLGLYVRDGELSARNVNIRPLDSATTSGDKRTID